jgi:GTPase
LVSFIGYVLSESNHTKNRIKFSNTDEDSLGHFKLLTKKLFSLDYIERVNKGVPEVEINSKTLTDYLDKSLDFKPKLSGDKEIPPALMGLTDNLTAILLRVLFDMEAYVPDVNKNPGGLEIEFTSKSKKLVEQVQILLNRFGIVGRFKEKIVNDESYWRLLIGGSDNHRLFRDKIGFNLKSKANRLNALCQCGLKRNRFFLPIVGLLDNLRQSLGLTQKQFFLDDKHVARMKRDNRITYHRIEEMADSTDNPMLRKLANSDNKWDEIANIEQEDYDDYVYDLTIEDTHTFIVSNGLIAHNTTLANKICQDWLGEDMGSVSNMAHETREIQIKEQVNIKKDGKELSFNLVDTPGIATRIDYEDFLKHGMKEKDAKGRAKEATKGVIDSIKWLDDMDAVIIVLDSTKNPYSQVNVTIIGNLEARKIPVLICANKTDLKKSDLKKVKSAFPQYDVVPISAKYAKGMEEFYEGLFVLVGK